MYEQRHHSETWPSSDQDLGVWRRLIVLEEFGQRLISGGVLLLLGCGGSARDHDVVMVM